MSLHLFNFAPFILCFAACLHFFSLFLSLKAGKHLLSHPKLSHKINVNSCEQSLKNPCMYYWCLLSLVMN